MHMREIKISGIILFLLCSCAGTNQFIVTKVGEEPTAYSQRFIYSLPQTVIKINLEFEKLTFLPGPYRKFTEKYLGVSQYINDKKTQCEITGIDLSVFSEPDPLHYYSVNLLKGSIQSDAYFNLSANGLVIDPMGMISVSSVIPVKSQDELSGIVELSMKRNFMEKNDTLFKTVIKDSVFVNIPILRKQKDAKTMEQKAEEAANLIIKIRKRRLKLVTGEYSVFPEGVALEKAIKELDETEQEYLSLFTGKIIREIFSQAFLIIPSGNTQKTDFAKFSAQNGILPSESPGGQPVSIEINPTGGFSLEKPSDAKNPDNTLYYRLPSVCNVRVKEADKLLYDSRISVFQAGSIVPLPVR